MAVANDRAPETEHDMKWCSDEPMPDYVKDDSLSGRILGGQWPAPLALILISLAVWYFW